jgi:hypothetical protein
MAKRTQTSIRVINYMSAHPEAKSSEIAKKFGISVQHVYVIRHSLRKKAALIGAAKVAKPKLRMQPTHKELPITMEEPKVDMVNSPPHYKVGGIEVIDYIKAKLTPEEFRGYLKGNMLKYTSRAGHKDDAVEDIGKLVWYANKLQETNAFNHA